ncbi:hypothetical protein [Leptospira kmetyi]|uniref:Uncharacterized protein n=1 Tax=Leptospira kmetyi TaxID=408139 RepID=A0ABX4N835_9LEPT|nr:hypothetical protein [Leptospira kmetyi]PJZ29475.1 hypothetical protein CH378_12340 [Leptospira kmetyi]
MKIDYLKSKRIVTAPNQVAFTEGYIQKNADLDELLKDLTSGHSIVPAKFKKGETTRKNENCESTNLIMLDFDGDLSVEEAINIFRDEAVAIVPTRNHQREKGGEIADRFRVILILPISVNTDIHRIILKACVSHYGHDKKCTDPARGYITVENGEIITLNKSNIFNLKRLLGIYFNDAQIQSKISVDLNKERTIFENVVEDVVKELKRLDLIDVDYQLPRLNTDFSKKTTIPIYVNIENDKNSTYSFDSSIPPASNENLISENHSDNRLIRNYDWGILKSRCEVFRDAKLSDHGELLILMTNLPKIKGGLRKLKEILKDRPYDIGQRGNDYYEKLRRELKSYNPIDCKTYCSRYETCKNPGNLLTLMIDENAKIKPIEEFVETISLDEARSKLKRIWDEIQNDNSNSVHLVIAPTGIGKTALLESLNENDGTQIIAGPRHELLDSLKIGYAYPVINTKKYQDIDNLLNIGYRLKELKSNELLISNPETKSYLADYYENLNQVPKEKIVKMTHEKLLYGTTYENISHLNCIYIDEDIMNTLYKIDSIDRETLIKFRNQVEGFNSDSSFQIKGYLQVWENLEDGELKNVSGFDLRYLKEIGECLKEYNNHTIHPSIKTRRQIMKAQTIYNLFYAEYALRVGEQIFYIQKRTIPKVKTVILSASPHIDSYKSYFEDRLKIHDVGYVKPTGKCYMFPRYSFSKSSMDESRRNELRKLEKTLKRNSFEIISHLNTKEDLDISAHFFATTGKRELTGKRLAVIGTPNPPEFYVKLKSAALGLNPRLVFGYQGNNIQEIEYNGFKFKYKLLSNDPKIIDIQLHFTYSELLQAIGRARNLFKDVPVLLFSKFPIRFFEICNKPGRYELNSFVSEVLENELALDSDNDQVA